MLGRNAELVSMKKPETEKGPFADPMPGQQGLAGGPEFNEFMPTVCTVST